LSPSPFGSIAIYTTFLIINTMSYKAAWLPLLLERVGVRRIKTTLYIPLGNCSCIALPPASMQVVIPTLSLKGEGAGTCM